MNKITYIISSLDDVNGVVDSANNVNIRISSLDNTYKYFKVKVNSFIINVGSFDPAWSGISYVYLTADNLVSQNQIVSGNRVPNILAVCNLTNGQITNVGNTFIMKNINSSVINFRLLDDAFNSIDGDINYNAVDTHWTLILELEGIE